MADLMNSLAAWLIHNSTMVLIGSLTAFGVITLVFVVTCARLRKTVERYRRLLAIIGEHNIEQLLLDQVDTVRTVKADVDSFASRLRSLEVGQATHLQHLGVVRFNAFADIGSDLSFAVALLDHHHNGVVLSCIHGRDEARTYAKPITQGRSSYALSREELLAIDRASQASSPDHQEGKRPAKSE